MHGLKTEDRGRARRHFQDALKRCWDVVLSAIGLVLIAPILGVVSLAIAMRTGRPVIFRQARIGKDGRVFQIYKFRTMTDACDAAGNPLPDAQRMTRLGNFLRCTSIDELPELLNVLRGEMSLVGPRPLLVDYRDLYTAEQWKRHEVKPGIAGPVAAFGRNSLSWEEKFVLDSWYVDHWSLVLDLKILMLTFLKALYGKGVNAAGYATMPRFEGTPPPAGGEGDAQAPRGDGLLEEGVMRQIPKKI